MNNNYNPPPYHSGYIPPYTPPQPSQPPLPPYSHYVQGQYYSGMPPNNPEKKRVRSALRRNANAVGGGLVIVVIVTFIATMLPELLFSVIFTPHQQAEMHHLLEQISTLSGYALGFGLGLLLMKYLLRIPAHVAFPRKKGNFHITFPAIFICLGVSVIGIFIYIAVSAILESGFGIVSTSPDFSPPKGLVPILLHIFTLTVMPAILEEFIFRGVILQSLRRFGDGFALVTSAILFSLMHGNLAQSIPTFLMGLCLGYFVLRTGSIFTGVLIHFINNFIASAVDLIISDGGDELIAITNLIIIFIYLLSGIVAFIHLRSREPNLFRVVPSDAPISEGKKYLYFFTSVLPIVFTLISLFFIILYLQG